MSQEVCAVPNRQSLTIIDGRKTHLQADQQTWNKKPQQRDNPILFDPEFKLSIFYNGFIVVFSIRTLDSEIQPIIY